VQVVGQIEIVLSFLVSWMMFRERIAPLELTGTILFVGGLVLLLRTGEA
jgi:drug/metabolite transporter (DMT)-like permease